MPKDELIAALEKATGPDRELDAAIFATVYPDKVPSPIVESGYGWHYDKGHWWLATGEDARTPPKCVFPDRFTASIDAALTLVPEGWRWRLELCQSGKTLAHTFRPDKAQHYVRTGESGDQVEFGATPALAICIAALRATERGEAGR